MRLFVNALSIGSLSGRHVLFGHLEQLAHWADGRHEFLVLHQSDEDVSRLKNLPGVRTLPAPAAVRQWTVRTAWEGTALPRLMQRERVDGYFSPSGTILLRSPVPQATLGQNPWCLVPGMQHSLRERCKAALQRQAYRRAFCDADLMCYNSRHMRSLYARNAPGRTEQAHVVAYQGIDETTFESAQTLCRVTEKTPLSILAVSVMARWKGIEVIVDALQRLHRRGVPARLALVGPWADADYRRQIEKQIAQFNLMQSVEIAGHVTKDQLHAHYAQAKVFCLMSRCESFGIPAVEAQAFGTPVVGSNVCAMEEVCGEGGECTHPDRPELVSDLLERLLNDEGHWERMSHRAVQNAARFHWSECSQPLRALFELGHAPAQAAEALQTVGAGDIA